MSKNPTPSSDGRTPPGPSIHNAVAGSVSGHVVQVGALSGDVHLYGGVPVSVPVPRQLPSAPGSFVGRRHEFTQLDAVLDAPGSMVVVSAVTGAGGIGKTWLVLHWAHQHLDRFPDGQLFVDLRGFSPAERPMSVGTAVRGFLDAFGVESSRIPVDVDTQIGLYRSLVAQKSMLIVFDNARDATQVASLLPGTPACTVLVTSRHQLSGLLTTQDTRRLNLDVLDATESRELLAARLGQRRVDAEPGPVTELLNYCAGLPLALSIVASRAAAHPTFALAELARELQSAAARLDALDDGDAASITTVLSWSFAALPPEQAEAFEMLGIAPGPDISLPAAGALLGLSEAKASTVLRALERESLLHQHTPGRWQMHDLVRLYAVQQAERLQPEDKRQVSLHRLLEFYLHTAHVADRIINPRRPPIEIDISITSSNWSLPSSQDAAWEWFDAEFACLEASERLAGDQWHRLAWQLTWALDTFRYRRGLLNERISAWHAGLTAARRDSDPDALFIAHRLLGHAYVRVGRHDDALENLSHALEVAKRTGNLLNQAHTHTFLVKAQEVMGNEQKALAHAAEARRLFQSLGHPVWEAQALTSMGQYAARLGQHDNARRYCEAALSMCRSNGDNQGETEVLNNLGYLAQLVGNHHTALSYYERSLERYRDLGHTYYEADVLDRVGQTYQALRMVSRARAAWSEALELYQDQHRRVDAERVQQLLADLGEPSR